MDQDEEVAPAEEGGQRKPSAGGEECGGDEKGREECGGGEKGREECGGDEKGRPPAVASAHRASSFRAAAQGR